MEEAAQMWQSCLPLLNNLLKKNSWEPFFLTEASKIIKNKCVFNKKKMYTNPLLTYCLLTYFIDLLTYWALEWECFSGFRVWRKLVKRQWKCVKGTFMSQILIEINFLFAPMPRTCILIENNQIKPPLQSDILKWALYLQGWKELPTFESESEA